MAVSFSDIAQLNLDEPDQLEWDKYKNSQATPDPVPDGVYDVQAPDEILFDEWRDQAAGKNHLIIASNDTKALTITSEGAQKGRKLFYPFVSARKYRNTMGSQLGDYIRAFGISAEARTKEEYAQLAAATAGRIGKVQTKQEAYCKACGQTVAERQVNVEALKGRCPGCGGGVQVRAKVDRWISSVQ